MQGEVVKLTARKSSRSRPAESRPAAGAPSSARAYILDMVDQLSRLAADQGEPLLAAMLREVSRRQHAIKTRPSP